MNSKGFSLILVIVAITLLGVGIFVYKNPPVFINITFIPKSAPKVAPNTSEQPSTVITNLAKPTPASNGSIKPVQINTKPISLNCNVYSYSSDRKVYLTKDKQENEFYAAQQYLQSADSNLQPIIEKLKAQTMEKDIRGMRICHADDQLIVEYEAATRDTPAQPPNVSYVSLITKDSQIKNTARFKVENDLQNCSGPVSFNSADILSLVCFGKDTAGVKYTNIFRVDLNDGSANLVSRQSGW